MASESEVQAALFDLIAEDIKNLKSVAGGAHPDKTLELAEAFAWAVAPAQPH